MVERLSQFVSNGIPCFFYTDFRGDLFHCYTLDELTAQEIEFSFDDPPSSSNQPHKPVYHPVDFEEYRHKFELIQEEIRSGNTYLLNLTQPTPIESEYTLAQIYSMAHAPYKMRVGDKFVCFSPEPFIIIKDNIIHTYPMKGTIDASIPDAIEKILNDPKEMAEHTMIVDLLRNDIGIVAHDIRVERFRYITTITAGNKHLHQVSSHISGKLPDDWKEKAGQLIQSLLPAGSISGTPKKKTVEIIEQIEGYERGTFTGIFGYFDGDSLYSAVSIRFIEKNESGYLYKSGGGITAESDCTMEYQEMIDKIYIP